MQRYQSILLVIVVGVVCQGCEAPSHVDYRTAIASERLSFRAVPLVTGLEEPWSLAFLPDRSLLVTERPGRLRRIIGGVLHPAPVKGLPDVVAEGQGGLLDLALHPDFLTNRLVYLSYVAAGPGGVGTEVARAQFDGDRLAGLQVIFRAVPKLRGDAHFGSRLLFAPDGTLLISLGERYTERDQAQNLGNHLGKIIRVRDDGSVPPDNPFNGRTGVRPEIFSYGHRNVQGLALDPEGRIWAHEHGPQGGDELNLLMPGTNYGWPIITYGRNYVTGTRIGEGTEKHGMAQPARYWIPSIAPSGLAFYSGQPLSAWRGSAFIGSLAFDLLLRLDIADGRVVHEERLLEGRFSRVRDVRQGPDGLLYVLAGGTNGQLIRIEPAQRKPADAEPE